MVGGPRGRGGPGGGHGDMFGRRGGRPRRPAPQRRPVRRTGMFPAILALDVLNSYRTTGPTGSRSSSTAEVVVPPPDLKAETDSEILIQAMCNVATADGSMSDEEQDRIVNRFDDLDDDEKAFLKAELGSEHISAEAMAQLVPDDLVAAAYTFSAMAIDIDRSSERTYLSELAAALGIDEFVRDTIHADLSIDLL